MLLGLHTYSLYLHGIGQAWAGFKLPWERQLTTFQLFDLDVELRLTTAQAMGADVVKVSMDLPRTRLKIYKDNKEE
jgi:hypothetical protein